MPHAAARRALTLLAACAAMLSAPAGAQTMYKWVDEKGVTHFSQDPPPDGRKATKVEPRVTPPSSPPPSGNWKQREQESRKQRLEKDQQEQAQKARAHNEEARRRNRCLKARRELNVLQRQIPVYSVNEKGERAYLEDKDRPAEIAAWQREADEHCR